MKTKPCGCTFHCDCSEQQPLNAPQSVVNPAGTHPLSCRVGTYASFFETLQRRLSSRDYPQLRKLHTRKLSDPSIALLDAWATVADVLTFYNERFINEGYLKTATEQRSLAELSDLIGYRPGPGIASSVYLAFTLEKTPQQAAEETLIPKGTAVKSVPGDNELPQTFETTEDLIGREEWNAIRPRQTIPQDIRDETVGQIDFVTLDGVSTRLVPNDLIVFAFPDGKHLKRYVLRVEPDPEFNSTTVWLKRTKFSSQQFVDDVHSALTSFHSEIEGSITGFQFKQNLVNNSIKFGNTLVPHNGLIDLDEKIDHQIPEWNENIHSITSIEPKITELNSVFDQGITNFVDSVKSTLTPVVEQFLSDQEKLTTIVTILKEAWGDATPGNGGISDNIPVDTMKEKLTTAIGDNASGITQAIIAWPAQVLKETGNQLLQDLTEITVTTDSTAKRKQFREEYLAAWAKFTDQSDGAFVSKRSFTSDGEYEPGKFETLVKNHLHDLSQTLKSPEPDFVILADAIKDARHASSPKGWLAMTGLSETAPPVDLRLKYEFVNAGRGISENSFHPISAQGLFDRLAKDPGQALPTIAGLFAQSEISLTQFVEDIKNLDLSSTIPNPPLESLKNDISSLENQIESISISTEIGAFATPVQQAGNRGKGFISGLNLASNRLGVLKTHVTKLREDLRSNFAKECNQIVTAFGNPDNWSGDDENAKRAKKDLIDPFHEYINQDITNSSLKSKVDPTSTEMSLNRVLEALLDAQYVPQENTPYESRYHLLVQNLELLQKQISGFELNPQKQFTDDLFPDAVGLAEALKGLSPDGQGALSLSNRKLTEVLNFTLNENRGEIPDLYRQIVSGLSPQLNDELISIWRQIRSKRVAPKILAFKTVIPLFGYNAPKKSIMPPSPGNEVILKELNWQDILDQGFSTKPDLYAKWKDGKAVYLSQPVEGTVSGSAIVFRQPPEDDRLCLVDDVKSPVQPGVLNISAPGSLIELVDDGRTWHEEDVGDDAPIVLLRTTTALVQSHELKLVEVPITDPVKDGVNKDIELNRLYPDLKAGQLVSVVGERLLIDDAMASEIATIKYVRHALSDRAGDKVHTRIILNAPLKHEYKRETVTISANVVNATHGETVHQILGSGDARRVFQKMPLKKGPLTYLSAPTASGVESTLSVRINDLLWHEKESLIDSPANGRDYVVQTGEAGQTAVEFGDGKSGARLPTGQQNVRVVYRVGLGVAGNIKSGRITQLAGHRPLGLKGVNNPLPATGGADPENTEQIRTNAPLAVMALDRLVSVRDYADFTRNYAGIEKACAKRLYCGGQSTVHITIAGAGDSPIAESSDLFMNLLKGLRQLGDPLLAINVQLRELLLIFLSARVRLLPDFAWEFVEPAIRAQLFRVFSFSNRNIGQDLYLSEALATIQQVEGVAYVDMEVLGTLSQSAFEKALRASTSQAEETSPSTQPGEGSTDSSKPSNPLDQVFKKLRRLTDMPDPMISISDAHTGTDKQGRATIFPAQIACLSPAVPDSLFLTEIKND